MQLSARVCSELTSLEVQAKDSLDQSRDDSQEDEDSEQTILKVGNSVSYFQKRQAIEESLILEGAIFSLL